MKGSPKIIEALNSLLVDELTAVNQYMVHAEMCDNWGYGKINHSTNIIGGTITAAGQSRTRLWL
jgi:bacterioferritin (cytochrome b1)